jgi:mRNA-degrading endonuclease RelE of RelBE toxin-antitoxin system
MEPYRIEYRHDARLQVQALPKHQQVMLLGKIREQLTSQPQVQTRNRKPLESSALGSWELRAGDLRAYYDVIEEERVVRILTVGVKMRDLVLIDGKLVRP